MDTYIVMNVIGIVVLLCATIYLVIHDFRG